MKLVKLSLIAAMATGIMATTASAAPLDEVIKDVDASGMLRMRYTHDSHKNLKYLLKVILNLPFCGYFVAKC